MVKLYYRIVMRLLFLLLFISLGSYSQKIIIDDLGAVKSVGLDSIYNELLLFYDDYYEKLNLTTFNKERFNLYGDKSKTSNIFVAIDSLKYFVSGGGGLVYQFKNDTIKRIDNSFDHRMQNGSIVFAYNSKIFKYGGYGFWSVRDFFIYFDKHTKEWEVDELISSKGIPQGTYGGFDIQTTNEIYFFDGFKINPHKRLERIINNEVWKHNFKNHEWKYLGENAPIENGVKIKYKNKLVNAGLSNLEIIDVINNKLILYEHNTISHKLSTGFNSFYFNNRFYCFIKKRGKTSLILMEEKDFFGREISTSVFYKNYTDWAYLFLIYFLIPALVLVLGWLGIRYYKKNSKIVLLENGLRFKNKFTEFGNESMEIIKTLLSEEEIYSTRVLKIVEKEQYSPAHNERIKNQKLNDINFKIKTLLGINEDIIKSTKSKLDKRIKIYMISREYFNTKIRVK